MADECDRGRSILDRHGVVVLRGAFSPAELGGLFNNLSECRDEALKKFIDGESPNFSPKYDFKESGMSLQLAAADPWTENRLTKKMQVPRTTRHPQAYLAQSVRGRGGQSWRRFFPRPGLRMRHV